MKEERTSSLDMDEYSHIVILTNSENKEFPLGIGFADEAGITKCFVPMDLSTASEFGEIFCDKYNEALRRIRGDT